MSRRVVITGIGAISPIGNNANDTWDSMKKGVNGIDTITNFDPTNSDVKLAAEVKNYVGTDFFDKKNARKLDKFLQFGLISAREAVKDSGITDENMDKNSLGVIFSSGIGGIKTIADNKMKAEEKGYNRISPFFIPMSIVNLLPGQIAIEHKAKGTCYAAVTACAGGTDSIGQAFRLIKDGYITSVIAGGSESAITPLGIGGFSVMRALNQTTDKNRASIPFDKERKGFVMGEGSGAVVVEELEHALKRNAKIYAEIVGYGTTCDANHITAPAEGGIGAVNSMKEALKDVGVDSVDYINAHGTSTYLNDKTETEAIKHLFGTSSNVSISSTKSMTGHLLGASGAIEAIAAIKAINDDFVPATINYKVKDEECDLDYTPNKGVSKKVTVAISNSLGFGGHNATIAFKEYVK